MPDHFADRLCAAIKEKGTPACVGLDPVLARLPIELRLWAAESETVEDRLQYLGVFCWGVIKVVAPLVPALKINSAFFEAHGALGLSLYYDLVKVAKQAGLIVIGDIKRGDIGHSTEAYALGHLAETDVTRGDEETAPDSVTVSSYLGLDGISPFLRVCMRDGKGIFALVQTSNESAGEIQEARLASGDTVALHVAKRVNNWAAAPGLIGRSGYSVLGAVVSPRDRVSTEELRAVLDRCIFLVPGYGAQGKSSDEIAGCFKPDGTGAIVNASRSVIYAFDDPRYEERRDETFSWESCVELACKDFVREVNAIVEMRTGG